MFFKVSGLALGKAHSASQSTLPIGAQPKRGSKLKKKVSLAEDLADSDGTNEAASKDASNEAVRSSPNSVISRVHSRDTHQEFRPSDEESSDLDVEEEEGSSPSPADRRTQTTRTTTAAANRKGKILILFDIITIYCLFLFHHFSN
jgi:hypothetical protein